MKITKGIRVIIGPLLIVIVLLMIFCCGSYLVSGDTMTKVSSYASTLAVSPVVFLWHVIIFVLMAVVVKRKLNRIEKKGVSREVLLALHAVVMVAFLSIFIIDIIFFMG